MNATVCGITPPRVAPVPRDPSLIAGELGNAADHLHALAGDFAAGVGYADTLAAADCAVTGIHRLLVERRQRIAGGAA